MRATRTIDCLAMSNPVIAFPAAKPELKLAPSVASRAEPSAASEAASQAVERHTLNREIEALRDRETNLRDYEARLRAWQEQIDSSVAAPVEPIYNSSSTLGRTFSGSPVEADAALQMAWEKLHRARELLEAEQAHVRDDRLHLKETEAMLKRHESALMAREANLAQREEILTAALAAQAAEPVRQPSALARITHTPFALARSVFGGSRPANPE
jgi:hypothetical protein